MLQFINSAQGRELAFLGTSCPDHFIRTKIRPLFVPWPADAGIAELKAQIAVSLDEYRDQYRAYYHSFATPDSPALRDPSPSVVLIPGLGIFSFGKNKTEARIVGEFYTNAIHVIEGAALLAEGEVAGTLPQCGEGFAPASFKVFSNYVALPPSEAFGIEYWAMEEAKLRRQPPEKELSRRIVMVAGESESSATAAALKAATSGAHVVIACPSQDDAARIAGQLKSVTSTEFVSSSEIDVHSRQSIAKALRATVQAFGGLDILIDTSPTPSQLLAEEAAKLFAEQALDSSFDLVEISG